MAPYTLRIPYNPPRVFDHVKRLNTLCFAGSAVVTPPRPLYNFNGSPDLTLLQVIWFPRLVRGFFLGASPSHALCSKIDFTLQTC